MQAEFITVTEYCIHHHTDRSFIEALEQSGLIALTRVADEQPLIAYDQLLELERYIHWYHDLDINLEGIETIRYLLEKVAKMQEHIHQLETRLRQYE